MARVNEFTPLLVHSDDVSHHPRPQRRRSVWQYVLAGALSLGVLSFFQQRNSVPLDVADVVVSFDESGVVTNDADVVAFLSSMETFKDPLVDPCVDFYEYACGGWLKSHEIPSDHPSIDASFYVVSETNKDTIRKIFDQNPPQIGPLYHSCLSDDQEVDANAITFVTQLIENVHQANSTLALLELAGEMDQSLGISTFFSLSVGADPQDPSSNVLQLAQGGLTLPSREYYLEPSKVDAYAALYVDYVTKLFAVGGLDQHNVSAYAEAVLETETAFAKISLSNAALRDPWTTNTAYPFAEIAQRYPFLMAYLNGIYKQEPFPMLHAIIATPDFFEAQNEVLSDESLLPQLKNYVSFHLIDSFGAILGESFRHVSHEFHGTIQGAGALLPRDQFCVRLTTAFLGDELGTYYMQDVFGPDAKAAAQALVAEIEESLKALLLTESWLDKVTYDAAVDKLNKIRNYIGGPDEVPPLPFELQADAFFNNVKSLMQLGAAGTIQAIGKPVDEQAWDMFPSTVNAYYDPSANKMVFPAAILQPPFYSSEHFPAAANFARIGMVMGHELSHGFDDQGRDYDGNGALRSWWTPSVSAEFAEKTQCLAAQYSTFPVVSTEDGHVLGMVNGNLTLGENIADNGGIHLAYEAYHLWESTFAPPPEASPKTTPAPAAVSSPDEPSKPAPNNEIPVVTPAPVIPIPDEPVPEPTDPSEQIPVAETPEPAHTEPSGDTPVATPFAPPVVSEPQPADIGPGGVIPEKTPPAPELPVPEEQTPAPTETEPGTETPVVLPSPSTAPTPPDVPDIPTPPATSDAPTPPDVPKPPASVPPRQPEPSDVTPDETRKHKHKKEQDESSAEPEEKEHTGRQKHHKGESGKDQKPGKSDSKEEDDDQSRSGHKRSSDKHSGKKEREEENSHESKHSHEHRHEDEDSERDAGGKHHHEKREEDGDRDKHEHRDHESKHERREDHHRRDQEEGEEEYSGQHEGKHHSHKEKEDRKKEDENDHHGKHSYRWDEDEGDRGRHEHHKHESKEERREERKERKKEKEEYRHHEKEKNHHHHDEDYDEDRESRHHEKHEEEREERREECGDCDRKEHHRHHRHKHEADWDKEDERHGCGKEDSGCGSRRHKWALSDSKYPFSGGDARIQSMVETLARAIVQPSDPVSDPVADDRLFFTAFAQNWCEKRTPGYAELLRTIDPHSPGKWRVNGPLMNYDKFAEVFSCPVGTPMNPEKKCVIW